MDRTVQKYPRRNVYSYSSDEQLSAKRPRTNWYESSSSVRGYTSSERRFASSERGFTFSERGCASSERGYTAPEVPHRGESTPRPFFSLDVRYFDQRVSDEVLLDMLLDEFNRFGICSVRLGRKFTNCEGVALVDYRYSEDAWRAREALNNRFMIGKEPVQIDAVYDDKMKIEPDRYSAGIRDEQYTRSSASYNSVKHDIPIASSYSRSEGMIVGRSFSNERDRTRYSEPEFSSRVRNPSPSYRGPPERNIDAQNFGNGGRISIKPHEPMCPEDDELATRSLFVGNLDCEITLEEIRSAFERYGKIEDIDVKRGDGRTRSSTFAFVRFSNLDMAYNCIQGSRGKSIRGLVCKIGYAKSRPTCIVWMSGVGQSLSLNDVKCGVEQLTGLEVMDIRKAGDNPSHAYVTFKNIEDASNAMRMLRGRTIDSGGERLRVDYAEASGVRVDTTSDMTRTQRNRDCGSEVMGVSTSRTVANRSLSGQASSQNETTVRANPIQTTGASNTSNRDSNERRNGDLTNVQTFAEISELAPTIWSGALTMKNSRFMARLLHVGGNLRLIEELLDACDSQSTDGTSSSSVSSCQLKISQRLHIDEQKLDDVRRKMSSMEYCILVALPPSDATETSEDADMLIRPLRNLITYLKQKDAAGIVSLPQSHGVGARTKGLLHAFPVCEFSREILRKYAGKISEEECGSRDHLVVIVIKS